MDVFSKFQQYLRLEKKKCVFQIIRILLCLYIVFKIQNTFKNEKNNRFQKYLNESIFQIRQPWSAVLFYQMKCLPCISTVLVFLWFTIPFTMMIVCISYENYIETGPIETIFSYQKSVNCQVLRLKVNKKACLF